MTGDTGAALLAQHHFLLVVFPGQGHINPSFHLARKLTALGHRVTVSTAVCSHRSMFPDADTNSSVLPQDDPHDPLLSIYPHSDGHDDGFDWINGDPCHFVSLMREVAPRSLRGVAHSLGAIGRPVTCIIYGICSAWSVSVARELGVPAVAFWVQPATVLAAFYHYFHGYRDAIDSLWKDTTGGQIFVQLPGVPALQLREVPSIIGPNIEFKGVFRSVYEDLFRLLDAPLPEGSLCKTRALVNSLDSLEVEAFGAIKGSLDVVAVGPLVPPVLLSTGSGYSGGGDEPRPLASFDLVKAKSHEYLEWLDSQKEQKSVLFISFGSYGSLGERQAAELARAVVECRRPYLWVTRVGVKLVNEALAAATAAVATEMKIEAPEGMVVEWCSQERVLSHRSIGCFMTHCGWNSTMEALTAGIPLVAMPQWADQPTIGKMIESVWQVGVRVPAPSQAGVVEARELSRCFNLVMGGGDESSAIRNTAQEWSRKIREATAEGGLSERNLAEFIAGIK